MIFVFLYLLAIVLANLTVFWFGPTFVIINAFLFIGLDLTCRDRLHERWQNNHLFLKMSLLILTGSLLTVVFSIGAWQIAMASFVAFAAAGIVDSLFYQWLRNKPYTVKVNGSNIPSALVDSLVFPTLAFGGFLPLIVLGQFAAKVAGGFVWSLILEKLK